MKIRILKNPVTRKRFLRFKSMKRAYLSLWIICILYGLSLFSEVICSNVPLYVKYNGRSYFPVITYYSENEFTGTGRQTRPNYRLLNISEPFAENPDNFMIFPLIPFSPFESIDPRAIAIPDEVELKLTRVPQIGTVDILQDFTIVRTQSIDFFFNEPKNVLNGENLEKYFSMPDSIKESIAVRFANQGAFFSEFTIQDHSGNNILASLATFRPRKKPPGKIRVTFKEIISSSSPSESIKFDRSLKPDSNGNSIWYQITEDEKQVLINYVQARFKHSVENYPILIDHRQHVASFNKEEVRFPYPPVKDHLMGIDGAGRDVLARIIYGLRISLTFGLMLVGCSMLIGVMAGAVQGYYAGKLDITAQRLIEIWSALPFLYVMILMGSIYGRSFSLLLICYGLFNWVGISYYIRAEFLSLRKRPFVEAAKCMGVPSYKIIFKHILPNAMVPVITFFPFFKVTSFGIIKWGRHLPRNIF